MENRIYVFIGEGISSLKRIIADYMCVREFVYKREAGDPPLSESDFILYCLGRRNYGGFVDAVSVSCDNGEYEPIVFGDFLSRVDEAIDVKPYFEELLALGVPIFYFAEHESSVERLRECGLFLYERGL